MREKRLFLIIFLFFLFVSVNFIPPSYATQPKGPGQKLARGLTHVLTAPAQLPKQILQTAAETEPFYLGPWSGMTLGAGKGLYDMGRQLVSGFFDVFTFSTPAGRDWAPLFEPSSLFPEI